jgi:ATP-dependent helicase/nuclease subunit B
MREKLGLPPPERRVGLSAHDFAQAACAPEVVLLNAERREGAPAVKSRWLWRLETLARGAGVALPGKPEALAWARALDRPERFAPAERPKPTPPVEVRPRDMFVTQVEKWVRDPYSIYARRILGLKKLERPSEPFEAAARGSAIHKALERFTLEWPEALPEDCVVVLRERLTAELDTAGMGEIAMVRERVLASECARWLAAFEARRRGGARILVERTGGFTFTVGGRPFTVSAKADRIEVREGRADVLDFKTGQAPTEKQIDAGFAPQLTLTAAILANGGFEGVDAPPGELGYVRVTGRKPPGEELIRVPGSKAGAAADKALQGLMRRVAMFDDESVPYASWAAPQFLGRIGGEYDQLARLWEWMVLGADEEEAPVP